MPTKGKSNLYGRGKRGQSNEHINYKYARILSPKHREDHVNRHGIKEMKLSNENQYKAAAISFANKVDRDNHESFVRANGITLKFSKTTGEFAAIDKEGTVTTFFKTSEKWWESEKIKNGR